MQYISDIDYFVSSNLIQTQYDSTKPFIIWDCANVFQNQPRDIRGMTRDE